MLSATGRHEKAEELYMEALEKYKKLAEQTQDGYWPKEEIVRKNFAVLREELGGKNKAFSESLEGAGYLVINPYTNLNVISYLGNITNIPKFSEKMVVYCSIKGLEQTTWIMQLREQLAVAITNGVEVFLVAEDKGICKLFYEKLNMIGRFNLQKKQGWYL